MNRILMSTLMSVAMAAAASRPLRAAEPTIRDDAQFFKPQTVEQATEILRQIRQQSGKELVVETFAAIPANLQSRFSGADKARFYREWSLSRAHELNVNGVYILIVRSPGHLEVAAGKNTRQKAFTDSDRERCTRLMLARFGEKRYDDGLLEGVRFVQSRIAANLERPRSTQPSGAGGTSSDTNQPTPPPTAVENRPSSGPQRSAPSAWPGQGIGGSARSWGVSSWLCIGAAVLIVVLLFRAARGLGTGYRGGPPPMQGGGGYYGPPGGGGGFGRGLMGGVLGGLFGGWMADRWLDRDRYTHDRTGGDGGLFDPGGTTHSGGDVGGTSGGDFGSDSGGDVGGGADFGGGSDSGGADSSGGDF